MTSQAAVHKRNLESSILFMQQEHAETLKGLHLEINQLQKKCTDLTFQLTMHGLNIEDSDDTENKFQELKKQLEEKDRLMKQKDLLLAEKDEKMKELEQTAKVYKKKYLDESRKQAELVNKLKAEVETKSCTVAYLTSKLHQTKTQNHDADNRDIRRIENNPMPAPPPKEMLSKPRRMPNIKRNLLISAESPLKPMRLASGRSSGSNHSSGSNRSSSPDIAAFLPSSQQFDQDARRISNKPTILPPIAGNPDSKVLQVLQNTPKRVPRTTTPEIPSLALDPLPHRSKNWAKPAAESHEYK